MKFEGCMLKLGLPAICSCPICIPCLIFSEDIVAVLFGHGAFNRTSVANTGELMKYFVLDIAIHSP